MLAGASGAGMEPKNLTTNKSWTSCDTVRSLYWSIKNARNKMKVRKSAKLTFHHVARKSYIQCCGTVTIFYGSGSDF
jgi:hypothetical protein